MREQRSGRSTDPVAAPCPLRVCAHLRPRKGRRAPASRIRQSPISCFENRNVQLKRLVSESGSGIALAIAIEVVDLQKPIAIPDSDPDPEADSEHFHAFGCAPASMGGRFENGWSMVEKGDIPIFRTFPFGRRHISAGGKSECPFFPHLADLRHCATDCGTGPKGSLLWSDEHCRQRSGG